MDEEEGFANVGVAVGAIIALGLAIVAIAKMMGVS